MQHDPLLPTLCYPFSLHLSVIAAEAETVIQVRSVPTLVLDHHREVLADYTNRPISMGRSRDPKGLVDLKVQAGRVRQLQLVCCRTDWLSRPQIDRALSGNTVKNSCSKLVLNPHNFPPLS